MQEKEAISPHARQRRVAASRRFAPLFLAGAGLMLVVCSVVNLLYLKNLHALYSMLPAAGVIALYALIQLRRR